MAASGTWSRNAGSSNSHTPSAEPSSIRSRAPSSRTCGAWRRGWSVLLADLVAASADVTRTPARLQKIARLADCLRELNPSDVAIAVPFLTGALRQGRIGVGYAAIGEAAEVTAASEPMLTLDDVDRVFDAVATTRGAGPIASRVGLLRGVFGRATSDEQDFLVRLLQCELRQLA